MIYLQLHLDQAEALLFALNCRLDKLGIEPETIDTHNQLLNGILVERQNNSQFREALEVVK